MYSKYLQIKSNTINLSINPINLNLNNSQLNYMLVSINRSHPQGRVDKNAQLRYIQTPFIGYLILDNGFMKDKQIHYLPLNLQR